MALIRRDVPQRLGIAIAKFVEDLVEYGNHLVVARACSLEPKRDAQPALSLRLPVAMAVVDDAT